MRTPEFANKNRDHALCLLDYLAALQQLSTGAVRKNVDECERVPVTGSTIEGRASMELAEAVVRLQQVDATAALAREIA